MSNENQTNQSTEQMMREMGGAVSSSGKTMEELEQALSEAQAKADQHWDRILRMQADMENLSRRSEKDIANAHKYALEKFALELLPVVDSLELSLNNKSASSDDASFAILEGVELTLKQFLTALEKCGVTVVNPVGQPFDSEYAQAISMQLDETVPAGTVISVLQKGYLLNQRLLRAALVVVSKQA